MNSPRSLASRLTWQRPCQLVMYSNWVYSSKTPVLNYSLPATFWGHLIAIFWHCEPSHSVTHHNSMLSWTRRSILLSRVFCSVECTSLYFQFHNQLYLFHITTPSMNWVTAGQLQRSSSTFCSNALVSLYNTLSLSRPPRLFNNNELSKDRSWRRPLFTAVLWKDVARGAHECWREMSNQSYPGWGLSSLYLLSPLLSIILETVLIPQNHTKYELSHS